MNRNFRILLLILGAALLFTTGQYVRDEGLAQIAAQAAPMAPGMASTNYNLAWFTPLTTNAGGSMASPHFGLDSSLGQITPGKSQSSSYKTSLGFWAGLADLFRLLMPDLAR